MPAEIKEVLSDSVLKEVAELAEKIWNECFTDIISKGQIEYMVEKFQSYSAMKEQVKNQGYRYFEVLENGEICGYFAIKPENDSRLFLSKLYLEKNSRGKGISSEMFARVFSEAEKCGKKSVYLTVNKYNDRAVEVYRHKGFKLADSVVTDIGNGYVMDDFIFEYRLK